MPPSPSKSVFYPWHVLWRAHDITMWFRCSWYPDRSLRSWRRNPPYTYIPACPWLLMSIGHPSDYARIIAKALGRRNERGYDRFAINCQCIMKNLFSGYEKRSTIIPRSSLSSVHQKCASRPVLPAENGRAAQIFIISGQALRVIHHASRWRRFNRHLYIQAMADRFSGAQQ